MEITISKLPLSEVQQTFFEMGSSITSGDIQIFLPKNLDILIPNRL
jgi:hypothetical protein